MRVKMEEVTRKLKALVKMKTKKEFDPDMVELFKDAISDQTPEDLLRAIKLCSKEDTYGIQPCDILKHIEGREEDHALEASRIASKVFNDYRVKMLEGRGELPSYGDEVTQHAFTMTRLENEWKEDAEGFTKFFRQAMKKNLMSLYTSSDYRQTLELKEAEEKEARARLYE